MQFQVQQLVPKTDTQRETDQLDLFAGVHSGLDDPYNVFFRVSDVENSVSQIYFYAYSFGKKKVVFWGVYDVDQNEFLVDSACRYSVNMLNTMIKSWKNRAYQYYSYGVRNRIATRMALNIAFDNVKREEFLFEEFKNYFMANLVRGGQLPIATIQMTDRIENLLEEDNVVFTERYQDILEEMKQHVSMSKPDKSFLPVFEALYTEMENSYDEELLREAVKNRNPIRKDVFLARVYKYIMINYFILLFSGMDEYRVAKFIVFSDERQKEKARFEPFIKGSFIYEWIVELSKILRSDDSRSFIIRYAKVLSKVLEDRLNMTDVGVIGGVRKKNDAIAKIANFFTEFVATSKYSKLTVVNDLEECPKEDVCDLDGDENCGLYDHGSKRTSKFDLT